MTTSNTNPHLWSLTLAALFVISILAPVGEMAARVAGY
ncbi:hypothetical protein PbB2_00249 [Candidatus Phycosocius bacilliformis]|uniref:Uncharacterized protein n=1 Tax=Candidatus Phycosocius bacilliformis TaxID=1445552 RepID=A0A2P2E6B5_9PROT|nr:hypothetical protein PbB2_00249 [Candidatus Phycosocius bacilliformis]